MTEPVAARADFDARRAAAADVPRCPTHPWTRLDARGCVTCRVLAAYPLPAEEDQDDD